MSQKRKIAKRQAHQQQPGGRTGAGFLAGDTFPSLAAALRGVQAWTAAAAAGGRQPRTLAAYIARQNPAAVVAKLATRAYWLELGASGESRDALELEDAEGDLRLVIFGGDDSGSMLLADALSAVEET